MNIEPEWIQYTLRRLLNRVDVYVAPSLQPDEGHILNVWTGVVKSMDGGRSIPVAEVEQRCLKLSKRHLATWNADDLLAWALAVESNSRANP